MECLVTSVIPAEVVVELSLLVVKASVFLSIVVLLIWPLHQCQSLRICPCMIDSWIGDSRMM